MYSHFQIVEDRGGLLVVYATSDEASLAVKKLHGENKGADSVPMVACKNFVPPVLATGHNPDIFVVRDLPDGEVYSFSLSDYF